MIDDLGESLEDFRYHRRAARQQRLLLATTAAPAESYYRREYSKRTSTDPTSRHQVISPAHQQANRS